MSKILFTLSLGFALVSTSIATPAEKMDYGHFSVSLAVKDIRISHAFYQKMGFRPIFGNLDENWIIMTNDSAIIGLFAGQFKNNILTFNPKDVRTLHKQLKSAGLTFDKEPEGKSGPAHAVLTDPDGNMILLDQP